MASNPLPDRRRRPALRRGAVAVSFASFGLGLIGCGGSDATPTAVVTPGAAATAAAAAATPLTPDAAAAVLATPPVGLVVLDVRTPAEFAAGHLAGAVLVDAQDPAFAQRVAELDPSVPYLVYCRSGSRSARAVSVMRGLGFTDLSELTGGLNAWTAAGKPVTQA